MVSKLVFDFFFFLLDIKNSTQDVVSATVQTIQNKQKRQVEGRVV